MRAPNHEHEHQPAIRGVPRRSKVPPGNQELHEVRGHDRSLPALSGVAIGRIITIQRKSPRSPRRAVIIAEPSGPMTWFPAFPSSSATSFRTRSSAGAARCKVPGLSRKNSASGWPRRATRKRRMGTRARCRVRSGPAREPEAARSPRRLARGECARTLQERTPRTLPGRAD